MKVLNIDDVVGEQFSGGAVRKVLVYSDELMMVYNGAPSGAKLSHSHPHEQIGYLVKGTARIAASGREVILKAGSSYYFEPEEYHEFEIIGNEPAVVLDVFRPPREDYIPPK